MSAGARRRRAGAPRSPRRRGAVDRVEEHGDEVEARLRDAAHVERVAHLAVERARHARGEPAGVGVPAGDQPRAPGAVQADRRAAWRATAPSWATAGPEPRATARASRRSANSAQPAARARERDQLDRARRQPGRRPAPGRRSALDDRLGRAERVGPDAQHHRVAGAHHAGGVGEDVGTALEDEPDDAERGAPGVDAPPVVVDRRRPRASRRSGESRQPTQPGDHVAAHAIGEHQPGRRAPRPLGRLDVGARWPRRSCAITSSSPRRAAKPSKNAEICSSPTAPSAVERRSARAPSPRRRWRARPPGRAAGRRCHRRRPGGRRRGTRRPARRRR